MRIANPIYDVVFKYLLDDNQLAKLVLSTILGEEITDLVFCPQEQTFKIGSGHLTVYRLDFAATVKNAAGETRQVLIEIQKAKLPGDIMRFRRYLGNQYRRPGNVSPGPDGKLKALPLLTVYFLGYALEHSTAPVIHVQRDSRDLATGEKLLEKEEFIESLTHDSYIIQIPCLHRTHRTELEKLLQVFDQHRIHDDPHVLEINETEVPERYRSVLRRLQQAAMEPEMADAMDVEDEILEELQEKERQTAWAEERAKKAEGRAEKAEARADRERAEKEKAEVKLEQERAEKEKAEANAAQERAEKERLLALLKQAGIEV